MEKTLAEWSDIVGTPEEYLRKLMAEGYSLERALLWLPKKNTYFFEGDYRTLSYLANVKGISPQSILYRIRAGHPVDIACTTTHRITPILLAKPAGRAPKLHGGHTVKELAKAANITEQTVRKRLKNGQPIHPTPTPTPMLNEHSKKILENYKDVNEALACLLILDNFVNTK